MHWSQMYTPGPATSLRTCSCPLPQKEHRVWRLRSSRSVIADHRTTAHPQPRLPRCNVTDKFRAASAGGCAAARLRTAVAALGRHTVALHLGNGAASLGPALDDLVDQPVGLGLLRAHEEVAV